jgi:hypothetical protein
LLSDYDLARGETSALASQKPEERIPAPPGWIPALAVVLLIAALVGVVFGGRYAWRRYAEHRAAKKASAVVSGVLLELNGRKIMLAHAPGSSSTISVTSQDLMQAAGGSTQP